MPTFYVTFAADKNERYVPLEQMAKVIADTPLEAARFALAKASGPVIGQELIWARVVVGTNPENGNWRVQLIPLDRAAMIPYDFDPPQGAVHPDESRSPLPRR